MTTTTDDQDLAVVARRLRAAREAGNFPSAAALARAADMPEVTYRSYENGSRPLTREAAQRLAQVLRKDWTWFFFGDDVDLGAQRLLSVPKGRTGSAAIGAGAVVTIGGVDVAAIPRFDAGLSAGPGSIVDPLAEPLGYQYVEAQWLRAVTRATPADLAVVQVDGDSMANTLNDGDWILVDTSPAQKKINREGIYALAIDDACWVKRISLNLRDKTVRVISDNPAYPLQELTENELTVIGKVVWIVGRRV